MPRHATAPSAESFDAIVIGGGPGGAATAAVLAKAGWAVVVFESQRFPRRKVCGEYLSGTNWPLLAALGVSHAFSFESGPDVRRVGLFAGRAAISADLPSLRFDGKARWGRALGRERLDGLLLERAQRNGACLLQPWRAIELTRRPSGFQCRAVSAQSGEQRTVFAPVVVAAHGSWALGPLPTQMKRRRKRPADLFGFKASFVDTRLPADLMPLVCFRDGYGGLVHHAAGRVSLSCCLRRDRLARLVRRGRSAGDAVLDYLFHECPALREAMGAARCDQTWLSAGPIRPGIRPCRQDGIFLVGNAAGEAHPAVAEGISMAMQAGWMLAERLAASRASGLSPSVLAAAGADYAMAWRRAFAPRIRAAAAIAAWAMHPQAVAATLPLIRRFPQSLAWGAKCSGKSANIWTGGKIPGFAAAFADGP